MRTFRFIIFITIFVLVACNPAGDLIASTPAEYVTMRSGLWLGTFTYSDEQTMDMTMDVMLDGSSISGEIRVHDEFVTDIQLISGTMQGMKVQFKDEVNRLYWGTLKKDGIEGFVGRDFTLTLRQAQGDTLPSPSGRPKGCFAKGVHAPMAL